MSCCTAHSSRRSYSSSTPRCFYASRNAWEITRRLAAHQLHGESHPLRGSHATAPIACDGSRQKCRFNARTLGWTGVSLLPLLVMAVPGATRYWQPAVSRSLLGRTNQRPTISFFGGVSLFSPGRSPRSRYLGFGFRQSSGNVLDEWVCSFQGAVRP